MTVMRQAYVYMLLCSDGTLYTGWTFDLATRLATHNMGRGSKYTRVRLPVAFVYTELCPNRSDAMRREYALKRLKRATKVALIAKAQKMAAAGASNPIKTKDRL